LVVEAGRYQVERTDARVLDVYGLKNVAQRKCVAGRQLIIDSRADGDPSLWNRKDLSKRIDRSEEHTSELQSRGHLVCRLLLEKKKKKKKKKNRKTRQTNKQ